MALAMTVVPGRVGSAAVTELDGPAGVGDVIVDGVAVGICGTDREIAAGRYGTAPDGASRLVIGHESLGRVREAPSGCGHVALERGTGKIVELILAAVDDGVERGQFRVRKSGVAHDKRPLAGPGNEAAEEVAEGTRALEIVHAAKTVVGGDAFPAKRLGERRRQRRRSK